MDNSQLIGVVLVGVSIFDALLAVLWMPRTIKDKRALGIVQKALFAGSALLALGGLALVARVLVLS